MKITDVRVRKVEGSDHIKAVASITIDGEFVVHDIKVIQSGDDLFMAMPSRKSSDGKFRDVAHPITFETRTALQQLIIEKYKEAVSEETS